MAQKTRGDEGRPATALANYTLTLTADGGHGTVTGGGSHAAGSAVTLTATPAVGYAFAKWSDGSYLATRTLTMPAQNTSLTAYFNERVPFGSGCSSITVPPIEPICSYPTLEGTTPLALEVPVPRFVLPVPPAECACFTFVPGDTGTATVTPTCANTATTRLTLDIVQADPLDCCSGRYNIVPTLDLALPCMPFSIGSPTIKVENRSGIESRGVDGSASFSIGRGLGANCCTLNTGLTVRLPDCVKYHGPPNSVPDIQISYFENDGTSVATRTHKFVTMVENAENCSYYPIISPLTLPCCAQPDRDVFDKLVINGQEVTVTLKERNCVPELEITPAEITIQAEVPFPPLVDTTLGHITASYKNSAGTTVTNQNIGTFQFTKTTSGTCDIYALGISNLNLTNIGGGGGLGSGGVAFQPTGSSNAYLDGSETGSTTWYGGGIGDITDDPGATHAFLRRGPGMRGNASSPAGANTQYIPYETRQTKIISGSLTTHTQWASTRKTVTPSGDTETVSRTYPEGYASGSLSMVMPTGVQWHDRGLAMTLNEFRYNESGLLSHVKESLTSVLVAPAKAVTTSETTQGGTTIPVGSNASGLRVISDWIGNYSHGLSVDPGDGLRIYNAGDGATPSSALGDNYDSTRQGVLEIMYGGGFRILDRLTDDQGNTATSDTGRYLTQPAWAPGAIEINTGRGIVVSADAGVRKGKVEVNGNPNDFMFYTVGHGASGGSTPYHSEEYGRLTLKDLSNEAYAAGPTSIYGSSTTPSLPEGYTYLGDTVWRRTNATDTTRQKDIIIPIVTNVTYSTTTIGGTDVINTIGIARGWLRFTDTGILLAYYAGSERDAPYGLKGNATYDTYRATASNVLS